jgi:glycerol-3-phosphate dehydrogenase
MIDRDCDAASRRSYDLIVIGGGIYGATLLLEAARRGLKALLVERDDFGGATSHNSLRIIHGGLRYIQDLDMRRVRESQRGQCWYRRHFPELVLSLPCLMPLYGRGTRRPMVLRAALAMKRVLGGDQVDGQADARNRPRDRVLDPHETASLFPNVNRNGLRGGALWHDCVLPHAPRVLIEILRWACDQGALALNYVEAADLRTGGSRVTGLSCFDRVSGESLEFRAPVVVNCGGPWCRELAGRFDRSARVSSPPCLLVNLLLDREPPAPVAVSATSKRAGARTYFLYPWNGGTLAGTYHLPCEMNEREAHVEATHIDDFLADLNSAVPGFCAEKSHILWVFSGLIPAKAPRATVLAARPVISDHGRSGGPGGLYSVYGVKYTTAPIVAQRTVRTIFGTEAADESSMPRRQRRCACPSAEALHRLSDRPASELVRRLVREESVVYPDDLLFRRTDWGLHPKLRGELTERIRRWISGEAGLAQRGTIPQGTAPRP